MLRITVSDSSQNSVALLLEGEIVNDSVDVLDNSCEQVLARGRQLTLNLKDVSFIDERGIALLGNLKQREVRIVNFSGFIGQLLNLDESHC
jgi:ABC-type transporter Mla MlaB component